MLANADILLPRSDGCRSTSWLVLAVTCSCLLLLSPYAFAEEEPRASEAADFDDALDFDEALDAESDDLDLFDDADEVEPPTAEPGLAPADADADAEIASETDPLAPPKRATYGIEEILITSRGNPESLLEAPMSVTAFDQEYLEALGATDIRDLSQFTPNLEIKSANAASNPTIFVRGVGLDDNRANASSSVAVLVDDVYMNSPAGQLAQLYDLSNVEVLRGPQGVFYGRNASAGAIRLITNKPSGDFGGSLRSSFSRFDNGNDGLEIEGFLEAPLWKDVLSTRLAGKLANRDGYLFNRCATGDARLRINRALTQCRPNLFNTAESQPEKWLNDVDNWSLRGMLRFQPPETDMDWNLAVHGGLNRSLSTQFQVTATGGAEPVLRNSSNYFDSDTCKEFSAAPSGVRRCERSANNPESGDPYKGDYFRTGGEDLDLFGANLSGDWELDDWTLGSVTAYEWHDRETFVNVDGFPEVGLETRFTDEAWQISQELEARWQGSSYDVTIGGYVLYEELDVFNIFFSGSLSAGVHPSQDQHQETFYGAGYVWGTWDIHEALTLEGGLRLNYERKTFDISSFVWVAATGERNSTRALDDSAKATTTEPTGELILSYKPTEEVTFYGKYTRGFKGTHFNGAAVRSQSAVLVPAEPEFVNALEAGWKSRWFDSLVEWKGAVFYYNYQNQQVFQARVVPFEPGSANGVFINELINANDTRVAGVETDVTFEYEGLRSFVTFSYLYSEYTDFVVLEDRNLQAPDGGAPLVLTEINNFSGNSLVAAPEFNVSGYLQYEFDLGRFGRIAPRLDYNWRSEVFFTPDNSSRLGDDARWILNTRLTWRDASDHVELAFWVRNVTDEAYRLTAIDLTPPQTLQQVNYVFSDPRSFGITLGVRF